MRLPSASGTAPLFLESIISHSKTYFGGVGKTTTGTVAAPLGFKIAIEANPSNCMTIGVFAFWRRIFYGENGLVWPWIETHTNYIVLLLCFTSNRPIQYESVDRIISPDESIL